MDQHHPYEKIISVCTNFREEGACCAKRGSKEIVEALKDYVKKNNLKGRIRVARSGCLGLCEMGPNVAVYPENEWFSTTTLEDVPDLIARFIDPLKTRK